VLGPGEGEAVAIALPGAEGWLLLDGCRSGDRQIGRVDVLDRWRRADEPVHAYALTHPHADHAKGLVDLVEAYGSTTVRSPRGQSRHARARSGTKLMARSASAVMVSDGFTPGFAETAAPSTTKRPG